jgi:hypothetical protein
MHIRDKSVEATHHKLLDILPGTELLFEIQIVKLLDVLIKIFESLHHHAHELPDK